MNIFKYAKEYDADYFDYTSGYIYHVQEYNRAKRFGLPTEGIKVSENGTIIGIVKEETKIEN